MVDHHLPQIIRDSYEYYDYRHALAILNYDFPVLFREICDVLAEFRFTEEMIRKPGGNESEIPQVISARLRPLGWKEGELTAKVIIDEQEEVRSETHKIDYVKEKIAFDLEWNSKDQTFDRDLYAFRTFFDYYKISVGILVTRSTSLQAYFATLGNYVDRYGTERPIAAKYGASTTHMEKLIPRLKAGRSGGCPVLALGITTSLLAGEN
jgi:CRISPR-associated protein Csd2